MNTLLSKTPAEQEVVVSRLLHAPRELVYQVWTDPQHLEQWYGPRGFQSSHCIIDLRVGGRFCLQMRGPDGTIYPCEGVFQEIHPPERIVYIGATCDGSACGGGMPAEATVTVTFESRGPNTLLKIHTRFATTAGRDAAVASGLDNGWASCLERLEEIVVAAASRT